jgi:AcrR family transcriptional regulator
MRNQTLRRRATQARSKATVEKILSAAAKLISERGGDPLTMTEIAQQSGVVIGSIYQYFSDKSEIMRALLIRHNQEVDQLLGAALSNVGSLDSLISGLEESCAVYFDLHQNDPLFRGIWSVVQTDAGLQALDAEDTLAKGAFVHQIAMPLYRDVDSDMLMTTCALLMQLALSAARFALSMPEPLRRLSLGVYQRMSRDALLRLERG